jgi:cysteine desulfurase/selenocysteine lyase
VVQKTCELAAMSTPALDILAIRAQFPILETIARGKPLVYLDNAATTQKPRAVIDAVSRYYEESNANIHRGVHYLSEKATEEYEGARETIQHFLNARDSREIIYTRGTTEAINLVASSWGRANIGEGDEIIVSELEHHSNIVPWQILCAEKNATLRVIPVADNGELQLDEYEKLLNEKTKIVAVNSVSNALGTINPIEDIIAKAHAVGARVLIDGAQSSAHLPTDVQKLDCDFYTMSGHKVYGPTGIGVLYGKAELLEEMPPYQGGGDMISRVGWDKTEWNVLPYKFEAGTPHIAGGIGLGAAIEWVNSVGMENIAAHENELLIAATQKAREIEGLKIYGEAPRKAAVLSFNLEGAHPTDVGMILDSQGVAIRTGHHCAQPLMDRYGVPATARASFAVYNTFGEVEAFGKALEKAREFLS